MRAGDKMAKSRWKYCLLESVLLLLVFCGAGEARRGPVGRGQGQESDDVPVERSHRLPDPGTVHGHRGYVGTLGVLVAAGLVIPAGVIAIIYLLYVYNCKKGDEDPDEMITGGKHEWGDISSYDVMLVNHLWSKMNGRPDDEEVGLKQEEQEMTALLMEGALGQDSQGGTETSSQTGSPSGDVAGEAGGVATMNGLGADVITPVVRETCVSAGNAIDADAASQNGDLTSTVEVHVEAEDTYARLESQLATTNDGKIKGERPVFAREPDPTCFKQAVSMEVVNQVLVELRLTALGWPGEDDGANDSAPLLALNGGKEKFVSEMQLYVSGFEEKADTGGRSFGGEMNDNGGWI